MPGPIERPNWIFGLKKQNRLEREETSKKKERRKRTEG